MSDGTHSRHRSALVIGVVCGALMAGDATFGQFCTPLSRSHKGWGQHAFVNYDLSGVPDWLRGQVREALQEWNNANGSNTSYVLFVEGWGAAQTVSITTGNISRAAEIEQEWATDGFLRRATIYLNLNHPLVDVYGAGGSSILKKLTLHEIGHSMGLGEMLGDPCRHQSRQASVMNGLCGVNDRQQNMSRSVTACDNESIAALIAGRNPGVGEGGGGGGGGGIEGQCLIGRPPPCADYEEISPDDGCCVPRPSNCPLGGRPPPCDQIEWVDQYGCCHSPFEPRVRENRGR